MTYQVLARKWRPKNFHEMAGQAHVLQTLTHALEQQRLHHAYLFTGTRGVGKTTVARILARCFNCEQGITATPCGTCSSCQEIGEGRFLDLIEVDAASRTRVEDTRELLENVQYAPTRGRFKVYLIDEVHMLSPHSFNALLKTLEEPPSHVKFLLATTDPQKLPVTVLSRCLQFHLKNLAPGQIVQYLQSVLTAEQIAFEEEALWQLARAANGSMRDGLTLLDQSISFGSGAVTADAVTNLLGTPDHRLVFDLASRLADRDAAALLQNVGQAAENNPDFSRLLEQLLSLFHRLAIAQMIPDGVDNSEGDREQVLALAARLAPEDVQLYYQVCQQTLQEMTTTPDRRVSFEMALLRMLAFSPDMFLAGKALMADTDADAPAEPAEQKKKPLTETDPASIAATAGITPSVTPPESSQPNTSQTDSGQQSSQSPGSSQPASSQSGSSQPASSQPGAAPKAAPAQAVPSPAAQESAPAEKPQPVQQVSVIQDTAVSAPTADAQETDDAKGIEDAKHTEDARHTEDEKDWYALVARTTLHGISGNILQNCLPASWGETALQLTLDETHSALYSPDHDREIAEALSASLQRPVQVSISTGPLTGESPAVRRRREKQAAVDAAHQRFYQDPGVQALVSTFEAEVDTESLVIHHRV